MKRKILLVISLIIYVALDIHADERMFHISRSVNANWVCYDARLKGGQLDMKDPVHVYWHNNSDRPGCENELSFFQRQMAYGYKVLSRGTNEVEYRLTAYKKRSMKLCKRNGHWVSIVTINGKPCILREIYVKTKDGNPMSVLYINLIGTSTQDGSLQKEKIENK